MTQKILLKALDIDAAHLARTLEKLEKERDVFTASLDKMEKNMAGFLS